MTYYLLNLYYFNSYSILKNTMLIEIDLLIKHITIFSTHTIWTFTFSSPRFSDLPLII